MIINGDGVYGLLAARRACGSGRLAWSKGRRPPGAVSIFIAWTVWTLAMALLWWQHCKYRRGYYYYYYYLIWVQRIKHCLMLLYPLRCVNMLVIIQLSDWIEFLIHSSMSWNKVGPIVLWRNVFICLLLHMLVHSLLTRVYFIVMVLTEILVLENC